MYGFTTTLPDNSVDRAPTTTIEALKGEGLGVLSRMDVQRAMKDKPGVGKPEVQAVTAVPGRLLRSACARRVDDGAPVRAV